MCFCAHLPASLAFPHTHICSQMASAPSPRLWSVSAPSPQRDPPPPYWDSPNMSRKVVLSFRVPYGDTYWQTLKFVYAALFPEDFSRFWSTLVNLRDIHKSLICTEQGGSICLGFGPLIFWKTQELENFRVQIEEQLSPFILLGIWLQIYYFWECLHCKWWKLQSLFCRSRIRS